MTEPRLAQVEGSIQGYRHLFGVSLQLPLRQPPDEDRFGISWL